MADNVTLNPGIGGAVIAADEIAGAKYQRVKLIHGDDGVNDGDISATNPLPVSGTVTANTGLSQPLTDAQLRAAAVPVSGSFYQATQPVSGPLTDAQLRATPVPISGTLGSGDLTEDAWGVQKMSLPFSLFHGMFTFDIPTKMWFTYEGGVQVYTSTNIVSTGGAAVLTTSTGKTNLLLESRVCPPYQPNRGHLFSTALICPSKTATGCVREWGVQNIDAGIFFRLKADGLLYAVRRSLTVEVAEQLISTAGVPGFNVEAGNTYDIQYQWRGMGNYKFFINNIHVHTMSLLGTLTALSMSNPALPIAFKATTANAAVANCSLIIGCVDITSENGKETPEQWGSAYSQAVATTGADKPVLVVHNPLLIGTLVNTRTIHLRTLSVHNTKKCTFKLWRTRSAADITGETLVAGYGGKHSFVQSDSTDMNVSAVRATAVTVANLEFIRAITVEAGARVSIELSYSHLELNLVRGDYLIVTNDSTAGSSEVVLGWGEEI
jgi:hypothetical protein